MRSLAAGLALALALGRTAAGGAAGEAAGQRTKICALLLSSAPADRNRGLTELEALLGRDAASCGDVLPALKEVLRQRPGAERARVAALLLKVPGEEAEATWWKVLDPAKETDDRVLASAARAVADRPLDPALARRLLDAARDPSADPWRRALALEALGGIDSPAVPLVLHASRPGAGWVEESCRALALGRRGRADDVAPLIDLLGHTEACPRVHAWEGLVRITHQNLPAQREPWTAWWREQTGRLPAPHATVEPAAGGPYALPEPAHVPRYYGVPILAKGSTCHAVFCLDVSASMKDHGIGPARRHLEATLLELPTSTSFDVISFNENVMPFAGRLVRAHPIEKARVVAWLDAIVPKSYTNIYDALEAAFQGPERIDLVFLLSDGAPNRGRYHDAAPLLEAVRALSKGRVPIHTIGAGESVLALLRQISDATGGTFQEALD